VSRVARGEIDPDTGLPPALSLRGPLEERLAAGEPVAVVKLDIDALGLVNALLGYEAGDAAISFVAREAAAALRECEPTALLAHESGGKFVVLVLPRDPLAGAKSAADVAERIHARVRSQALRGGAAVASVALSAGVAASPAHGRDARILLRSAEAALEEAKRTGRDRVA